MRNLAAPFLLCWLPLASSPPAVEGSEAGEDEAFLETASIVDAEPLPLGVTRSHKVTLSDGQRTIRAIWKTIDERQRSGSSGAGHTGASLDDSYKHEIAAYELDKLLGLRLVPPTVGRKYRGRQGSMQLWLDGVMTERERGKRGLEPPDPSRWNAQMHDVKLFQRLTSNADHRNTENLLVDADFRIYVVDNSRAFRRHPRIFSEQGLTRFSRRTLQRLRALRREEVSERLGTWLDRKQIEALLRRRDRIVELAERRIAEEGEAAVLHP